MKKYFVPFGRISDYQHPAKDRTAGTPGFHLSSDYIFTVYPSREAMKKAVEKAERRGVSLFALVKDAVPEPQITCRGYQRPETVKSFTPAQVEGANWTK